MILPELLSMDGARSASWILLAILATALHFYLEPFRWSHYYCRNSTSQSKRRVRQTFLLSSLASYLLPFKLGVPLRLAMLHRLGSIKVESLGAGMLLDAIVSLFVWTAWSLAAALILTYRISLPLAGSVMLLAPAGIGLACFLLWFFRKRVANLRPRLIEARVALRRHAQHIPSLVLVLAIDVGSYGIRHVCIVMALVTPHIDLLHVGAAGILATFVGIISGLPMGLVGYDATIATLLLSFGLPVSLVAAVIAINRLLNFTVALLLGIPAAIALGMGNNPFQIVGHLKRFKSGS